MTRKILVFLVAIITLVSLSISSIVTAELNEEDVNYKNQNNNDIMTTTATNEEQYLSKISDEVLSEFNAVGSSEKLSIYVWLTGLSDEHIDDMFLQQDPENFKLYSDAQKASDNKQYREEYSVRIETLQPSIESRRQIIQNYFRERNSRFISEYICDEDIIHIDESTQLCIVKADKNTVMALAKDDEVVKINLYVELEFIDLQADANSAIRADYVRDSYGLDGTGVKIGQIENAYLILLIAIWIRLI